MIQKTLDYSKFKLRNDNRSICQPHLQRLISSIESRNLLEYRPIVVNGDYEIIDGQHRLQAAKFLGLPIYYQVEENAEANEMRLMNISRSWNMSDYMNFFCKNNHLEYLKLQKFIKENNLTFNVGLCLSLGTGKSNKSKFKSGDFVFPEHIKNNGMDTCHDTIGLIKRIKTHAEYTKQSKFWTPLLRLTSHEDFEVTQWRKNIERCVDWFGPRTCNDEYFKLFQEIYNYKAHNKIDFSNGTRDE